MQQVGLEPVSLNLFDLIVSLSEASDEVAILKTIAHFVGDPSPHLLTLCYLNETEQADDLQVEVVAQIAGNGEGANGSVSPRTTIATSFLAAREATFMEDMSAEPLPLAMLPSQGIQSAVLLPMYANRGWQGIIAIGWLEKRAFSSIEKSFFNALPRPIAASIASRRAYHEAETARRISDERARELETVTKVSAIVARILNLDELLPTVCDLTKANFNLYHVNIYLLSDNEQNMLLVAGAGEIGRMLKTRRYSVPLSQQRSLLAVAVQKRETVIVDDVTKSLDYLPNPLTPHTRSEMVIPIIIGSTLIGALVVQ
ncbi:MAG TPA: GAF domain-containing protein, partial [Aggregatilineales bacterium]|nr:GAF domain-containing protein [Aggregatilineales bacterium]